ncbi:MAG TPA: hypothetical protein VN132_00645 [Bdellovibrio sp.]|nr:hypothetical protein [Bdellovibrio sp.]
MTFLAVLVLAMTPSFSQQNCVGENAMYGKLCLPKSLFANFPAVKDPVSTCLGKNEDHDIAQALWWKVYGDAKVGVESDQAVLALRQKITRCDVDMEELEFNGIHNIDDLEKYRETTILSLKKETLQQKLGTGRTDVEEDLKSYQKSIREFHRSSEEKNYSDFLESYDKNKKTEEHRCAPRDLRSSFPPIQNQEDSNVCYAYVAADLLQYKLHRKINPIDVAYQFKKANRHFDANPKELGVGEVAGALSAMKENGLCKNEDLKTADKFSDMLSLILRSTQIGNPSCPDNPSANNFDDTLLTAKESSSETLGSALERACSPRIKSDNIKPRTIFGDKAPGFDKIDDLLTNYVPIGVEVSNRGFGYRLGDVGVGHALTLVGRAWDKESKSCQYILRNSWGPGCKKTITDNGFKCDSEGHIIMSRSDLIDIIQSATYLE